MALKGTNQEFGRPYNRRVLLEAVRLHGPITRAELARQVGLSLQTVSNIVAELEAQGFVVARSGTGSRDSRAPQIAMNPDGGYAIGVHVTPLGLEVALINLVGETIAHETIECVQIAPDVAFERIGALVRQLSAVRPGGRILGVGMAMPGPFGIEGMSFVGSTTLEGWKGVPILERLAAVSPYPVFIEGDTAAAAHAARLYGRGTELRNFYYLYFGVGLGGCMVTESGVVRGTWGNAGEIGHLPLVPDGEDCPCGNRGCLERHLSHDAFERRPAGQSLAEWVAEVAPLLRSTVVIVENLFDPETVIIGGSAPRELLEALVDATAELPNSVAERDDRSVPRVLLAANETVVLRGAAALAISAVLSPRFGQMFRQPEMRQEWDPMMQQPRSRISA